MAKKKVDEKAIELKEGLKDQLITVNEEIKALEIGSEEWLNAVKGQQILAETASDIEKNENDIQLEKKDHSLKKWQLVAMGGLQILFLAKDSFKDLLVLSFEETGFLRSSLSKTKTQIPDFISKMKS